MTGKVVTEIRIQPHTIKSKRLSQRLQAELSQNPLEGNFKYLFLLDYEVLNSEIKKRGFPASTRGSPGRRAALFVRSHSLVPFLLSSYKTLILPCSNTVSSVPYCRQQICRYGEAAAEHKGAHVCFYFGWLGRNTTNNKTGQNNLLRESASKNRIKTGLSSQFLLFVSFVSHINKKTCFTPLLADCKTMAVWERNYKAPLWQKNKRDTIVWHVEVAPML